MATWLALWQWSDGGDRQRESTVGYVVQATATTRATNILGIIHHRKAEWDVASDVVNRLGGGLVTLLGSGIMSDSE